MKTSRILIVVASLIVIIGGGLMIGRSISMNSAEEYLAASYKNRLGSFTVQSISVACNTAKAPEVSLSWTASTNATSYSIERAQGTSNTWVKNGQVAPPVLSFIDKTWTSDYPAGSYRYHVIARNRTSSLISNSVPITIPVCSTTSTGGGGTSTTTATTTPPTATTTPPTATTTPPTSTTTPPTTTNRVLWGAMTGNTKTQFDTFQTIIGKTADHTATFVHWGNENAFPSDLGSGLTANQTLIIFWEVMDYNYGVIQPRFNYDSIITGSWDSYINSFKIAAKTYGKPVIIVLFEEMNSDWYPWSVTVNGNTPAKHVAAYQHVRDMFRDAPNVKFAWNYNDDTIPNTVPNTPTSYYPGANYVDIVGVDSFNFGLPWETAAQMLDAPLAMARTFNKPIYIFSFAAAEDARKPAWITDTLSVYFPAHPEIKGWVWFNENKEKNWLIWSSPASLAAFQAALPK